MLCQHQHLLASAATLQGIPLPECRYEAASLLHLTVLNPPHGISSEGHKSKLATTCQGACSLQALYKPQGLQGDQVLRVAGLRGAYAHPSPSQAFSQALRAGSSCRAPPSASVARPTQAMSTEPPRTQRAYAHAVDPAKTHAGLLLCRARKTRVEPLNFKPYPNPEP